MLNSMNWFVRLLFIMILGLMLLIGCDGDDAVTPEATPLPEATAVPATEQAEQGEQPEETNETETNETADLASGIVISELLPGVPGANSREFIELYNAGQETADLQGWSLWYVLNAGDETLVKEWSVVTEIPGYGHYLLVHEGHDFGLIPDTTFDLSLFERKGGLILRNAAGETADILGWGDAPEGAFVGSPAGITADGASLERLPGGDRGEWSKQQ